MTPLDLSQAVLALRVMIEREEQVQDILQRVDSIEKGVKRCGRVEEELEGMRTECKKLRSRNKRLERDICKCNEEKEQLVQELERTQDFHRSKIEKLARYAHFQSPAQHSKKQSKCSYGVQCETICEATVLELYENQAILRAKLEILQQKCNDLHNQNSAKDLYINELISTVEFNRRYDFDLLLQGDDEKETDNSTLDNDSEKSSINEELQPFEEEEEQQQEVKERKGWLDAILSSSLKLHSFIFG